MALLSIMGDRTTNTKLTARTPVTFKEAVEDLRTKLQRERRWFYCGEKVSLEAIVNVAVLNLLQMSDEQRARVLDSCIPQIERMFEDEEPSNDATPAGRGEGHEVIESEPQAKRPRRREAR